MLSRDLALAAAIAAFGLPALATAEAGKVADSTIGVSATVVHSCSIEDDARMSSENAVKCGVHTAYVTTSGVRPADVEPAAQQNNGSRATATRSTGDGRVLIMTLTF